MNPWIRKIKNCAKEYRAAKTKIKVEPKESKVKIVKPSKTKIKIEPK